MTFEFGEMIDRHAIECTLYESIDRTIYDRIINVIIIIALT